jgi:hypothetical protein
VKSLLCALGHVATTSELERAGLHRRERAKLLASVAYKPRRGVFACRHLEPLERLALACRARLDCITVLRAEGIWTGHYRGVHLRLKRGDRHATQRVAATGRHRRTHWDAVRFPGGDRTRVSCSRRCSAPCAAFPPKT